MKKLLSLIILSLMMNILPAALMAQDAAGTKTEETTDMDQQEAGNEAEEQDDGEEASAPAEAGNDGGAEAEATAEEKSFSKVIKEKFIEGDPLWMAPVLICMVLGLAIVIERIIYLNMATTNTKKLLSGVEEALNSGGVSAAKEVCRNTSGPVAGIFYEGLERSAEGVEIVEKSIVSYGSVQAGMLEKGMSWISLFIALAPMLGFLGTVVGMVGAFDAIAAANNISPSIVATGIKVALLTTIFGLIVAIILQIFYNYLIAKIDSIIHEMETASIELVDMLVIHEHKNASK